MPLVTANTVLSEAILNEPSIIPVINRFGIYLGCGDETIGSICKKRGLDAEFLVTILNAFINDDYFPEHSLKSFCASTIVEYLQKANAACRNVLLPNIERHFMSLMSHSEGMSNNLGLIHRFFSELKNDILARIEHDDKVWFPEIMSIEKGMKASGITPDYGHLPRHEEDTSIDDKLHDLKNLFIMHLSGSYDANLCYAVIVAIAALQKDIRQNDRIRNRILAPLAHSMRSSVESQD